MRIPLMLKVGVYDGKPLAFFVAVWRAFLKDAVLQHKGYGLYGFIKPDDANSWALLLSGLGHGPVTHFLPIDALRNSKCKKRP